MSYKCLNCDKYEYIHCKCFLINKDPEEQVCICDKCFVELLLYVKKMIKDKNEEKDKKIKDIKFEDYVEQIQEAIRNNLKVNPIPDEDEGFTLVKGFFNQPIQQEIASKIIIGGVTVPMVAIVGNKTARMYFFALKVLLPDIEV